MLFEFFGEGIYPEILESYIKTEAKKSSSIIKNIQETIKNFKKFDIS